MNPPQFKGQARRLLGGSFAVALASFAVGCEPIYVGVVAVAGASIAEPGDRGLVVVREPGGPGGRQIAQVVVSARGHVVTPLEGVILSCEPRETCATHGDLIQLLTPSPDLPYFDIKVEKAGFTPEHVKIAVASAREVPWRQVFVVLAPGTGGVAR